MQDPKLLGLVEKHHVEDHLRQFGKTIVFGLLLSHGQIKVWAQVSKVLREGRRREGLPLTVPREMADENSLIALVSRARGKAMERCDDSY